MLSISHLDIRYGDKHLFKDLSVQVYDGNRIGLMGVNGAGKSTLLKIMAGVTGCDDGVLNIAKQFTVAYLPQESSALTSGKTLYEEAESAFAELLQLQDEADKNNLKVLSPLLKSLVILITTHRNAQSCWNGRAKSSISWRVVIFIPCGQRSKRSCWDWALKLMIWSCRHHLFPAAGSCA